jgi:ribose-phosphate pyrophosphokinase
MRLFALNGTVELGQAIAHALGQELARREERDFEDGEHKARPLDPVRGADVYVAHSLYGGPIESVNDKLCRLLFFIGALRDAGAARVTAVIPYLCYARKDRRTKPNDPVITRYVAALFEAVGVDAVVALEVHNETAFENAFRCRAIALTAAPLWLEAIKALGDERLCVVSPDIGGSKRADALREALEAATGRPVGKAFAEKRRSAGVVSGDLFAGDVAGATCIIIDDLVSTGGTLARAGRAAPTGRREGHRLRRAWPVHARRRGGARRPRDRQDHHDGQRAAVSPRRQGRSRQARHRSGGAAARRGDPPAARGRAAHRPTGVLRSLSSSHALSAARCR